MPYERKGQQFIFHSRTAMALVTRTLLKFFAHRANNVLKTQCLMKQLLNLFTLSHCICFYPIVFKVSRREEPKKKYRYPEFDICLTTHH
jgi:hypothetical protein